VGNWYDYYSYKQILQGDNSIDVTSDKIPLFVAGGGVIV
jgi:alpha-glucosidase (family GH31 glycosyl hydrolase)